MNCVLPIGKWLGRSAVGIAFLGVLSLSATQAGETIVTNVGPNTKLGVVFSAQNAWPVWSLEVQPQSGYNHKPESLNVNSSRWKINPCSGANGDPARFVCVTISNSVELQFHDRIFSGRLAVVPVTGGVIGQPGPGPVGPTPPPPPEGWSITGKTDAGYEVLPEMVCTGVGSTVTFYATNPVGGGYVVSAWTSAPYIGITFSNPAPSVTFTCTNPGKYHIIGTSLANTNLRDVAKLIVIKVDMTAHRPCTEGPEFNNPFAEHEVPEEKEENPGAGIRVNGDPSEGANENDLIKVELKVEPFPVPLGVTYVLKRNNSNIKVWDSRTKTKAILDSGTEATITINSSPMSMWVENPSGGNTDLELVARSGGRNIYSDKIHFYAFKSIVIVFGGRNQVPSDPVTDANFSAFVIATNLYHNGYDVHMYDEQNVANANAEVDSAVAHRSVTQVAVFGYSWGGDAVFDVADHLNVNTNSFTIRYTAYIDAVNNPYNAAHVSQDQRPTNTLWHANYYQRTGYSILNLRGNAIVNPPGANTETNLTAAGVTHLNVDDLDVVRNGIFSGVTTHVDP